eukprot:scaffold143581_cov16-Tisochrysis_lutea.AAC.2
MAHVNTESLQGSQPESWDACLHSVSEKVGSRPPCGQRGYTCLSLLGWACGMPYRSKYVHVSRAPGNQQQHVQHMHRL